jgi:hypothetical protein
VRIKREGAKLYMLAMSVSHKSRGRLEKSTHWRNPLRRPALAAGVVADEEARD